MKSEPRPQQRRSPKAKAKTAGRSESPSAGTSAKKEALPPREKVIADVFLGLSAEEVAALKAIGVKCKALNDKFVTECQALMNEAAKLIGYDPAGPGSFGLQDDVFDNNSPDEAVETLLRVAVEQRARWDFKVLDDRLGATARHLGLNEKELRERLDTSRFAPSDQVEG